MNWIAVVAVGGALLVGGCREPEPPYEAPSPSDTGAGFLHQWNAALTDVLVTDIVSPPVASRMYVYPNIAAYEALANLDPAFRPLSGQLEGLEAPPPEDPVDPALSASVAFATVARAMVFGPGPLGAREDSVRAAAAARLPARVHRASVAYGEAVGEAVLAYMRADRYGASRAMSRYLIDPEDRARWQPTPPDYMEGLEPNWRMLRTFALASSDEFAPPRPPAFDSALSSPFMREALAVRDAVSNATPEQEAIARFWDCNPLVSSHDGHFITFSKKITPGGHWLGIAGIAARRARLDAMRTAEVYALTAISLADGFISCWDEKYRSCLVRPETVINAYVDPDWRPILQTPSFPEYTSGHSVVSGAASTVLTALIGDDFAFVDSTEVEFGLGIRSFTSFNAAAEEAAMSRFYGGIHYRPAIENGLAQGRSVGRSVVERLVTRARPAVAAVTPAN